MRPSRPGPASTSSRRPSAPCSGPSATPGAAWRPRHWRSSPWACPTKRSRASAPTGSSWPSPRRSAASMIPPSERRSAWSCSAAPAGSSCPCCWAAPEQERQERDGTSFLKYRDAAGRVADFHALRHTYVSRLVQSGASVKVAQELARHSTPTLTLGRYAHIGLVDQTKALDALPTIDDSAPARQTAVATGTDDAAPGAEEPRRRAAPGAARRNPRRPKLAIRCHEGEGASAEPKSAQGSVDAATCPHMPATAINTPERTRTSDLRFRKPPLCPAELRA